MTIDTLSSDFCVDFQSIRSTDFSIKENEFTAGFTDKDVDGINAIRDTWKVSFSQMPYTEMTSLWLFLQERKGYIAFRWTPPREDTSRKWVCVNLKRSMESHNSWSVEATFQEQFSYIGSELGFGYLSGVHGTTHLGSLGHTAVSAGGIVPVPSVSATGMVGEGPFPVNGFEPYFFGQGPSSIFGFGRAHIATDGYMYVLANKFIMKVNCSTFKVVDILDLIEMTGVGLVAFGGGATQFPNAASSRLMHLASDATYLYVGPYSRSSNRAYFRIALSDFRTTTKLDPVAADFSKAGGGGLFTYGGYLWLLPYGVTTPYITRVALSDFSTVTTLDLTPFQVTGDTFRNVYGYVVHDHYCTMIFGGGTEKYIMRLDLNDFTSSGVSLFDRTTVDAVHYQTYAGRGAWDGGNYLYFANYDRHKILRVHINNTSASVFDFGVGADPIFGYMGTSGVVLDGDILYAASAYDMTPLMVKIDLASNGGVFSNLTVEFINIYDYSLGDNPAGDRKSYRSNDIEFDGQYVYYLPMTDQGDGVGFSDGISHYSIRPLRIMKTQGSYDPYPPTQKKPDATGIVDYDWAGGDNDPDLVSSFDYPFGNAISEFPTITNNRKYLLAVAAKLQSGGTGKFTGLTLGGFAATLIAEVTDGSNYAGFWLVENASSSDRSLHIEASDPVFYYDIQIYTIDGLPQPSGGIPSFIGTPITGNGKDINLTYNVLGHSLVFGAVAIDQTPTDWDRNFTGDDAADWSIDNQDEWGPETDYGDATNLVWQMSLEYTGAPDTGRVANFSWDFPPDTEDLNYVGLVIAFSFDNIGEVIDKYVIGTQARGFTGSSSANDTWDKAGN